jgi:hypothetical protein
MAKGKARTAAQKELDKDKRLQSKYDITLVERTERARQQDNKCKICSGPLDPPCVDHFHFVVKAWRNTDSGMLSIGLKWYAESYDERMRAVNGKHASTKAAAIAGVKKETMRWSIRGLLCRHCNRALGMLERWFDAARTPDKVLPSLDYLRKRLENS